MNRNKEANEIFELLYTRLKEKLKDPECKDSELRIALDFVKTFNLSEEVNTNQVTLRKVIEELPFDVEV
jgi:hypothetical protein